MQWGNAEERDAGTAIPCQGRVTCNQGPGCPALRVTGTPSVIASRELRVTPRCGTWASVTVPKSVTACRTMFHDFKYLRDQTLSVTPLSEGDTDGTPSSSLRQIGHFALDPIDGLVSWHHSGVDAEGSWSVSA